jgi:hypothetical protein
MGPTVLGEMQLPLHLRRDGVFFWWPPKKGRLLGIAGEEKVSHLLNKTVFIRIGSVVGGLLQMF